MGSDGNEYTTSLMRYLYYEWSAKKGGQFIKIVSAADGVPQQQNGFDCGKFSCMFTEFLFCERALSFMQDDITN